MANIYYKLDKTRMQIIYRSLWTIIFCLGLYILSINFLLSSPQHQLIAQSSSSPEQAITPDDGSNQTVNLEAARQQYLLAWNDTDFNSQFDVFIEEGSSLGYGVYKEHVPANVFRPGETIVLYVEPIGFGHQPITDPASSSQDGSDNGSITTLYLVNMTADYVISDSNGTELQTIEDVPVGNLISHRQNLELFLTLTLTQGQQSFPPDDYTITYIIHDQVSGESFQIDKKITIAEDTTTGSSPVLQQDETALADSDPEIAKFDEIANMCQNMVKAVDARGASESSPATAEETATATRCADMILQAVDKYCNNFETYDATRCAHVRDDPSLSQMMIRLLELRGRGY